MIVELLGLEVTAIALMEATTFGRRVNDRVLFFGGKNKGRKSRADKLLRRRVGYPANRSERVAMKAADWTARLIRSASQYEAFRLLLQIVAKARVSRRKT
jgi:hypothetical protein